MEKKKETQPIEKDTRLSDIEGRVNEISRFLNEQAARRNSQLQFPIDFRNRRVINRDLPVIKSIDDTGYIYTVEINDREHEWDFTPSAGGGGGKSVTLIVGPAANADSDDYDYTTDGTDDDVQIQAAIDALTTGGTIVLREGTYTLGAQVNVDNPDLIFRGVGERTVVTVKTNFGFDTPEYAFYLTGARPKFEYIKFDGNDTNQTDAGIFFFVQTGATDADFNSCAFTNNYGSVFSIEEIVTTFRRCRFVEWSTAEAGWPCIMQGDLGNLILRVYDCYFSNSETETVCIEEAGLGSVLMGNYSVLPASFNTTWWDGMGGAVIGNFFTGGSSLGSSAVVINGDQGISRICENYITVGGSSNVASIGIRATLVLVANNYISGVGRAIQGGNMITGNYIDSVEGHGIYIEYSNTVCTDNKVLNSGQAADNTYDGIFVAATIDRCVITGNRVSNNTSVDHRYGINVSAATCDNNIVSNNILTEADTAQLNDAGTGTVTDGSNVIT